MSPKGGIINRRSPRRMFAHSVGVLYRGEYEVCKAHQLSEGGILFECPWALNPGEKVVVTILVPGGGHCVVPTEIRYISKVGQVKAYGCKFAELPLLQRRLIRNYVSGKTREEAESDIELTIRSTTIF